MILKFHLLHYTMGNNGLMKKITDIVRKTIGSDIVSTAPIKKKSSKIPEEPKHPANEHWNLFMNLDGTYEWKKQEVDHEFEPWDAPKAKCYPWDLSEDDMKILIKHKMAKDEVTFEDSLDYYFRGDKHLHIVTDKRTWKSLCGRHWVFDLDTKEIKLIRMN